ncbi:MAG: tetratricopeptide repeat protein, partial [Nanoarchaeota archaeon]
MTTLEEKTIEKLKAGECSVERALLVVSGLQTEEEISSYQQKLDHIQRDFEGRYFGRERQRGNEYQTAGALFDYLWKIKSDRYNEKDFLLAPVIDNHLDENKNKKVGNCIGLTSLYTALGQRLGLDLSVLSNIGHILNLLHYGGCEIGVENSARNGFDYKYPKGEFKKGDLTVLVATVFNSRGEARFRLGDLKSARFDFDQAVRLNPIQVDLLNNKGVVEFKLGNYNEALLDLDQALQLDPDYGLALQNKKN